MRTWLIWVHVWTWLLQNIKDDGLGHQTVRHQVRTVHALLVTECDGKDPSLVSLVPRRIGLEAWRRAQWEKMYNEGRDLGDGMLASWEKGVTQYRVASEVQTSSEAVSPWRRACILGDRRTSSLP